MYKITYLFPVLLKDKSTIIVKGKGLIILFTSIRYNIQLNNMLYSSQFKNTLLLLISKIAQAKINVNFLSGKVYLINKRTTIATSIYLLAIGLYYLD